MKGYGKKMPKKMPPMRKESSGGGAANLDRFKKKKGSSVPMQSSNPYGMGGDMRHD